MQENFLPHPHQLHNFNSPITVTAPPAYIHFVSMELLKNATTTLIDKYGMTGLDTDAPPIEVTLGNGAREAMISSELP